MWVQGWRERERHQLREATLFLSSLSFKHAAFYSFAHKFFVFSLSYRSPLHIRNRNRGKRVSHKWEDKRRGEEKETKHGKNRVVASGEGRAAFATWLSLSARETHSTLTTRNLTRSQKSINYERDAICNFPPKESTNEFDWVEGGRRCKFMLPISSAPHDRIIQETECAWPFIGPHRLWHHIDR